MPARVPRSRAEFAGVADEVAELRRGLLLVRLQPQPAARELEDVERGELRIEMGAGKASSSATIGSSTASSADTNRMANSLLLV